MVKVTSAKRVSFSQMMSAYSLLLVLGASPGLTGGSVTEVTLLLLLLLFINYYYCEVTCDECRAAARDFTTYLLSEQSLAEQSDILQRQVCPQVLTSDQVLTRTVMFCRILTVNWRKYAETSCRISTEQWLNVSTPISFWIR